MSTEDETNGYFERVVTDEVKRRMIELAYGTCTDIADLDQNEVGAMIGGILGYGVYLGLALARDGVEPPENEISAFLVMYPEIIEAVEKMKTDG